VLDNKVYKHTLRIFNTYCFTTVTTILLTHLTSTHILSILVALIDTWTKTPLSTAQVNSWSNSIHTTTCSGDSDSILWIFESVYHLIKLPSVTIKKFHSPETF